MNREQIRSLVNRLRARADSRTPVLYEDAYDAANLIEGYMDEIDRLEEQAAQRESDAVTFGRQGGLERASRLTPERRREIARLAALTRWAAR